MAYDEATAGRVRAALSGRIGIVEHRMMGGLCFMVDGGMCCGVVGAALLVRVGRTDYAAALQEAHVRALAMGGRRPAGFVLVDPPGFAADAALAAWLRRGAAAAAAAPAWRRREGVAARG